MNKQEPAFPGLHPSADCRYADAGMTLRDYFAAKAMQAYYLDPEIDQCCGKLESVARWSYEMADAMLEARK
jgi:hypothetical protein